MTRNGLAKGTNSGTITTERPKRQRPVQRKGSLSKHTSLVRSLVREVVGLAPYERRILDMIKTGGSSADKRIYKFGKKRLGSHKRSLKKDRKSTRSELQSHHDLVCRLLLEKKNHHPPPPPPLPFLLNSTPTSDAEDINVNLTNQRQL